MTTEISISIIGAVTAVVVSIIGAWPANRSSVILQIRRLKEEHYIAYIEAIHNLASGEISKELTKKICIRS